MILPDTNSDDEPHSHEPAVESPTDTDPLNNTDPIADTTQEISFHALTGSSHPRALRLPASINGNSISILVDTGSTHNYLHPKTTKFLGLQTDGANSFVVIVGNGEKLQSEGCCSNVRVEIQGHIFFIDFHLLEIVGSDAVCGIQWLENLGPVTMDHKKLTMTFTIENRAVHLTGLGPQIKPFLISIQQFKRLETTSSISNFLYLQLQLAQAQPDPNTVPHQDPQLQKLLTSYGHIFSKPTSLPPNRPLNHHINLLPNANPINTKPYRYPYFQKNEIERQIQEMLQLKLIQPSTSPFSSPVLLVKKRWIMEILRRL